MMLLDAFVDQFIGLMLLALFSFLLFSSFVVEKWEKEDEEWEKEKSSFSLINKHSAAERRKVA